MNHHEPEAYAEIDRLLETCRQLRAELAECKAELAQAHQEIGELEDEISYLRGPVPEDDYR